MPKPVKPRFIFNVPLKTTSSDRRELKARRNAGLRVQNLCLGEAETRRKLMQASDIYKYAKSLPRTVIEFFLVWQNKAYGLAKSVKKAQTWRSRNRKKENVNTN